MDLNFSKKEEKNLLNLVKEYEDKIEEFEKIIEENEEIQRKRIL